MSLIYQVLDINFSCVLDRLATMSNTVMYWTLQTEL